MEVSKKHTRITSYAEYLQAPTEERWELIDGVPFNMSPSPSVRHQIISTNLLVTFANYLKGKSCKVLMPIDVCLFADGKSDEDIRDVVQPDLVVVCDLSKLEKQAYRGAPDLVVEVVSPSSVKRDRDDKLKLYRKAKVKEYWIVDPENQAVDVYRFAEQPDTFPDIKTYSLVDQSIIPVGIFDDLEIDLHEILT